ncbi:MAG: BON domain-containing protein, partial [Gemmatimonadota bacterium]|nr:BON domain-containing protein [Gemmatimonadota bacterium]
SASARAVAAALQAEPRLAGIAIDPLAVARGVVELRGWVPSRPIRTLACRTALAVPGIESVINSLLVRGEDDATRAEEPRATDQSA